MSYNKYILSYMALTSFILFMKASLFSFAFLLRLSPFRNSVRNTSKSKRKKEKKHISLIYLNDILYLPICHQIN